MDVRGGIPAIHLDDGRIEHRSILCNVSRDLGGTNLTDEEVFFDKVDYTLLGAILTRKRRDTKTGNGVKRVDRITLVQGDKVPGDGDLMVIARHY
jgi:hypothetical protein